MTSLFALIVPILLVTSSTPDSVLIRSVDKLKEISTIRADLQRIQTFRGITRIASGSLFYGPQGTLYRYATPEQLSMFYTDSVFYSIKPDRASNFRMQIGNRSSLRDYDPLGRYLRIATLQNEQIQFSGSFDSMMVFRNNLHGSQISESIGIHRTTRRFCIVEWFDSTGQIVEQTSFFFSGESGKPLPSMIVTRSILGGSLLIDSLIIRRSKVNTRLPDEFFRIPE